MTWKRVALGHSWAVVSLVASVIVWAIGDLLLTLILGHPTTRTVEVPLVEVVVFLLLGLPVLLHLIRKKNPALISVVVFSLYAFLSGLLSGSGVLLTVLSISLLVTPFLALLVSVGVRSRECVLARNIFLFVFALQLVLFPANYLGLLSDMNVDPVDRYSGTLLGQGGYLSSYVMVVTAAFVVLAAKDWLLRIVVSAVALAYSWIAEVKLGIPTYTVILVVAQFLRTGARGISTRLLSAGVIGGVGVLIFMLLPPAWTMNHDNIATSFGPSGSLDMPVGMEPTESVISQEETTAFRPSPLSKVLLSIDVLNPMSDLWDGQRNAVILGVGPSAGLSQSAQIAERGDTPALPTMDSSKSQWRERVFLLRSTKESRASIVLSPQSTLNGLVSELGWVGLALFMTAAIFTFRHLLFGYQRVYVAVPLGLAVVLIPLTSVWEIPGVWLFVALGLAGFGNGRQTLSDRDAIADRP